MLVLLALSYAKELTLRDPIHGLQVRIPANWNLTVFPRYVLITSDDMTRFTVLRVKRGGNLKEVARAILAENQKIARSYSTHFKRVRYGILLRTDMAGYPYLLDPMLSINWGLVGRMPPSEYTSLTYLIPLKRNTLVVSFYYPRGTPPDQLEEMVKVVRSFRFTRKRTPSKKVVIRDPETGQIAATLRIPRGWDFFGTVLPTLGRNIHFVATRGEEVIRMDVINVSSVVSPVGYFSEIKVNERSFVSQAPVSVNSLESAVDLLISLWNSRGGGWELTSLEELPETAFMRAFEESMKRQVTYMGRVLGRSVDLGVFRGYFTVKQDNLVRTAFLMGFYMNSFSPMGSDSSGWFMAFTVQGRDLKRAEDLSVGVLTSFRANPSWFLSKMKRNLEDQKYWNRVILGVIDKHNEFLTRTSLAWENILSEQTFVRDPETGEIFQVDLSEGHYWRDPVEGFMIGGVEEMSELESILRSKGWRKLDQSLEGFPEQWR